MSYLPGMFLCVALVVWSSLITIHLTRVEYEIEIIKKQLEQLTKKN